MENRDDQTHQKINLLLKALDNIYPPLPKLLFRSFFQGLFTALGATIGLSIILAVVTFILNKLGFAPSLKEIFPQLSKP